ncbi:WbqC family protein [Methanococcoides sp. SA1]|nr:WbqC family protein [Methanococcoides sp. SA1]
MTVIAIHQPNYLPYLGFFDKMKKADLFIIYDDAQFNSRDFQQRNKIRTSINWNWLNVPIIKEKKSINKIKIRSDENWNKKHFNSIRANYSKASYYSEYCRIFEQIYENNYEYLVDLNMDIIKAMCKCFNINTEIRLSSEFNIKSKSTRKLIELVSACDGDTYLSGSGGNNYMDTSMFIESHINLIYQDFIPPVYSQRYPGFISNLSAIDYLFNEGSSF